MARGHIRCGFANLHNRTKPGEGVRKLGSNGSRVQSPTGHVLDVQASLQAGYQHKQIAIVHWSFDLKKRRDVMSLEVYLSHTGKRHDIDVSQIPS